MPRRRRRKLSQHFLHDPAVLARIVQAAEVQPGETVVEIGAGRGNLTRLLCAATGPTGQVLAIELDADLIPELEALRVEFPWCRPVHADVLQVRLEALGGASSGVRLPVNVVGNLPYAITTPIVEWLVQQRESWRAATLTVQEEVARRLAAPPGSSGCGAISVFLHFYCTVELLFTIGRGAFVPPPRVRSAVVRLRPRSEPPVAVASEEWFFRVARAAFGQRRKTLGNALSALGGGKEAVQAALRAAGIDPRRRGETLSMEELARVAEALSPSR